MQSRVVRLADGAGVVSVISCKRFSLHLASWKQNYNVQHKSKSHIQY